MGKETSIQSKHAPVAKNWFKLQPVLEQCGLVVTDRVLEIRNSGSQNQLKNGFLKSLFAFFFAIFLAYLIIFQKGVRRRHCKTLKNYFKYDKNLYRRHLL